MWGQGTLIFLNKLCTQKYWQTDRPIEHYNTPVWGQWTLIFPNKLSTQKHRQTDLQNTKGNLGMMAVSMMSMLLITTRWKLATDYYLTEILSSCLQIQQSIHLFTTTCTCISYLTYVFQMQSVQFHFLPFDLKETQVTWSKLCFQIGQILIT